MMLSEKTEEVLRVCKMCGLIAFTDLDLDNFKKNVASKYQRENLCLSCHNQIIEKIRKDKKIMVLSPDVLRAIPEINKALNTVSIPYVRRDIRNIFSETGVLVFNYRFVAQPYRSAFILHISKPVEYRGKKRKAKPFNLTLSIRDLLDQVWRTNKRLPKRLKKTLDIIYEEFIEDKTINFQRALGMSTINLDKPLEYQKFMLNDFVTNDRIEQVYCKNDQILVFYSKCLTSCSNFVRLIETTKQVYCKRSGKIFQF